MIKVEDIDYDLSLKLGDPVIDHGDGQNFHLMDRLKYLSRAYGRLLRNLEKLARDYQPHFSKQIEPVTLKLSKDNEMLGNAISPVPVTGSIRRVVEMYVRLNNTLVSSERGAEKSTQPSAWHLVTNVNEDIYLSVKNGKNDLYTPSYDTKAFFYTVMGGLIYLLPEKAKGYSELSMVCQVDVVQLDLKSVINMSNDYRDLLIVMAANEGMQDLARADKVALYSRDIQNELQILGISTQKFEKDEGKLDG